MADGYAQLRTFFQDISGSVSMDSVTADVTPIAPKPLETIFIQRLSVDVTAASASVGAQWVVSDTNATPLTAPFLADAVGSTPRDFLAVGRALKEGEGLKITADLGAIGIVTWQGYRKLTGIGAT